MAFPFSSLKPNTGAQLYAEISLLSPSLVAHHQGGEHMCDPVLDLSNAANAPSENAENLGANDGVQEVEDMVQMEGESPP